MKQMQEFSDHRYKGACPHCGVSISTVEWNDDHVPSKVLLDNPFPPNIHVVRTCVRCNSGFSSDEEYFAAFLGATISGSTEPAAQKFETARKILAGNAKLRREIEATRVESVDSAGNRRLTWTPDLDRIQRVVLKSARGHAFHELARIMHRFDELASGAAGCGDFLEFCLAAGAPRRLRLGAGSRGEEVCGLKGRGSRFGASDAPFLR